MDALGRARRLERVRREHEWNPGSGHTQFDRPLLTDVSHVETVTLDIEGRALACTDARANTIYPVPNPHDVRRVAPSDCAVPADE